MKIIKKNKKKVSLKLVAGISRAKVKHIDITKKDTYKYFEKLFKQKND
jgi:hypothetical protein